MRSGSGTLRDTGRFRFRLNQIDGDEDIENAEATDDAAKRGVQEKHANGLRQVREDVIALPKIRPGQVEKERTHLQTKNDKNDAKRFIHERRSVRPRKRRSASGLLKRSDAVGNVAIIDVGRIDLRETFERRLNVTRGFLCDP